MIKPVPLNQFYYLINHGPTAIISAQHQGIENAMSASWVCAVDFMPTPKLSVVLDKSTFTRQLIEQSGYFVVQIPVAKQANLVMAMGQSRKDNPHKMDNVPLFYQDGFDVPMLANCAGWIMCKLISEPHHQTNHDLFIGKVLSAWADDQIFENGRWKFEQMGDEWRTLHYIAGGQFYTIGKSLHVPVMPNA